MIDHRADRPVHKQLADLLRDRIASGDLTAGERLPAEPRLADQYDIGRNAVRDGLAILRTEGLISTIRKTGTVVRPQRERTAVELQPGETAIVRMPTEPERAELDIDEGVPLIVIQRAGKPDRILLGDRTQLTGPEA